MTLSKNTRKRLWLYGAAVAVFIATLVGPRIISHRVPPVSIRALNVEEAKRNEASRLLEEFVRIPTPNPPGHTRRAVEFWARAFSCEGIPYQIVGDDPDRPIFVGRLAGRTRQGGLLLLHHMDVVPEGDLSKWREPPYTAEMGEREDKAYLYGRGTLDMKSVGIAHFLALAALKRSGIVPLRDIVFLGEPGEETFAPETGVGWVFENRPDLVEGVTDVYNEGGITEVNGTTIVRFGIETLQKAIVSFSVDATTRKALEELKTFLEGWNEKLSYRLVPEVAEFMRAQGPTRSDVWGRLMFDPERAVSTTRFREIVPDVYRTLIKDMIYCGEVVERPGGGFTMDVVWTLLPQSSVEATRETLLGWIQERGLTARLRLVTAPSVATPAEGPAWNALVRALELDPEKAPVELYVMASAYTNSSYLRARGLRAFGFYPFNVNILDAAKVHHENERISLPLFVEGVERMKRILFEFATAS